MPRALGQPEVRHATSGSARARDSKSAAASVFPASEMSP
eukprot:CAMPEP_0177402426 /NCGR_PEP_ID=MMETSP0368-20130122/60212_1 /TAXON_ID=447022 ORGANISM="Scrippsiella hangoei-like, Strain SHHI-4" /NCGR_SAMPLE_ID=MMETSP0368 /ASSEMBLY_ACC=CAM_ASM_000363 /LENGTH=38 /DNA_ID= /DNA_START= /DNA_END= /DNA_ORIENTATION=